MEAMEGMVPLTSAGRKQTQQASSNMQQHLNRVMAGSLGPVNPPLPAIKHSGRATAVHHYKHF